jgi:hypothetical protein
MIDLPLRSDPVQLGKVSGSLPKRVRWDPESLKGRSFFDGICLIPRDISDKQMSLFYFPWQ